MKGYIEIKSQQELQLFLREQVSFHDGILKEMQMINRGFVMEDRSMNMDHKFDARMLFQTQSNPAAFELLCLCVEHFKVNGPHEFTDSSGEFIESPEKYIQLSLDGDVIIQCKQLFYKTTPTCHGNSEHLGSQVPSADMTRAKRLDGHWRQCGECSNVWEVQPTQIIATCPTCNKVTCTSSEY